VCHRSSAERDPSRAEPKEDVEFKGRLRPLTGLRLYLLVFNLTLTNACKLTSGVLFEKAAQREQWFQELTVVFSKPTGRQRLFGTANRRDFDQIECWVKRDRDLAGF
jgi:hypothetical protein